MPTDSAPWVQFGALGIVAFVIWRLVNWITSSLNGKLDRLGDELRESRLSQAETNAKLQRVTNELTGAMAKLTAAIERSNASP